MWSQTWDAKLTGMEKANYKVLTTSNGKKSVQANQKYQNVWDRVTNVQKATRQIPRCGKWTYLFVFSLRKAMSKGIQVS